MAVIELPQGEYELYAFIGARGIRRVFTKDKLFNRFEVIAGKAVYLGNIHIWLQLKVKPLPKKYYYKEKEYYYQVAIADMRERYAFVVSKES